ncbi:histidinol-phosphate transaminase [Marilutibacter alkalisoli]|uniref:Histidinol-phosphate aminotransferase n=1 Tax=Marilutibacter alkalisoli TaxID=2591633 RepID=A0A514BRW6_9GAMM|nr:histidinol-phosphate transaminase [Lysobacter alkalisoli]QDH70126.1 histidinol-phosphate transaminase [Lysobacter alkalisoli]
MSAMVDDTPFGDAPPPVLDEAWFAARATTGIQGLKAYDPGHDLVAFRRRCGDGRLVELGSNENPYGPSPRAREAILANLHMLHRYPDPLGGDLKRALSARHGIGTDRILLGNGSHELLMQMAQVFAGPGTDGTAPEVVAPRFGFAVFALATQAAGAHLRIAEPLPRDSAMPLGHDLDALLAAITPDTRLLYVANPNNPTGTWFGAGALADFIARVPREVIVVVDEAYAEMADAPDYASALGLLDAHPNVVVTRTFSKAYGLAGLRVGYLIGAPGLVAVMERLRESFNVNGLALTACEAALGDEAHIEQARIRNAEQRESLSADLRGRGLEVFPSQTNFVLVGFGREAAPIESALTERGVILRPMGGYGLPDCLRITVGDADENRRLLAALDECL